MDSSIKDVFKVSLASGVEVKLSDILNGIGHIDDGRFFAWKGLVASLEDHDPILYTAWREVLLAHPVRALADKSWFSDLLFYSGEPLGNGEPCRSTGHWNPPDQTEIFEVISGTIVMLIAVGSPKSRKLFKVTAKKGDMVISPFGCWHTTYALYGPATVFNIYTGAKSVSSNVKTSEKYKKQPPVSTWLVKSKGNDSNLSWQSNEGHEFLNGSKLVLKNTDSTLHEAMVKGDDIFLDKMVRLTQEITKTYSD